MPLSESLNGCSEAELYAHHLPKCAYCGKQEPNLIWNNPWRESIYKRWGFWPKIPVCSACKTLAKRGELPSSVPETDIAIKARIANLKSKAHWISLNGGNMEQLSEIIREVEKCSQFVVSAEHEFRKLADLTSKAAAKLEWLQSMIREATECIERKTQATYSFCRNQANKVIAMPDVRKAVFERAGHKCEQCGSTDFLSIDHIVPVKRGGPNFMSNLQCLCLSCNCSKGDRIKYGPFVPRGGINP